MQKWHEKNKKERLEYNRQWRIKHPECMQNWRAKHKKEQVEYARQQYINHREKYLKYSQQYYIKHPEYAQKWRTKYPEKYKITYKKAGAKRRSTPKGKLNNNISCRIYCSLKNSKAGRHWEDLVGYTINQLKSHLERQFTPEMSWGNYGSCWSIDHIIPISRFNFEKPEDLDFRRCWTLKNLQPLEAKQNKSKNNKINKPFQPSLIF